MSVSHHLGQKQKAQVSYKKKDVKEQKQKQKGAFLSFLRKFETKTSRIHKRKERRIDKKKGERERRESNVLHI